MATNDTCTGGSEQSGGEPLDVEMSASKGKPHAVEKLLEATKQHVERLPDEMELSVEIRIWEDGIE